MTSFKPEQVFFTNQDRHDLFGAVKVMTFTVTKYE